MHNVFTAHGKIAVCGNLLFTCSDCGSGSDSADFADSDFCSGTGSADSDSCSDS